MFINNEIRAIIMAGGKGSRMKIESAKCAALILKKPMIEYVYENIKKSGIDKIITIVGYKKEDIINILKDKSTYCIQERQLGTADAIKSAKTILENKKGITLIINGDAPLIDDKAINKIIEKHIENENILTFGITTFENNYGFGRVIKKNNGIIEIIEENELNEDQKNIKDVNIGLYLVDNKVLFEAIEKVDNNNLKEEYYLTDIVKIISKDYKAETCFIEKEKAYGANDLDAIKKIEKTIEKEG